MLMPIVLPLKALFFAWWEGLAEALAGGRQRLAEAGHDEAERD